MHEKKYILLRRLYVSSNRRNKHIGTQIVRYIQLYSKFNSKEFRVNVYDDDAEKFYNHLGFKLKFKTFGCPKAKNNPAAGRIATGVINALPIF